MTDPLTAPSPAAAGLLSLIWPGLGQWYLARRRRAILLALPPLVVSIALAIALIQSPEILLVRLLVPAFAATAVVLIGIHAGWRLLAVVDAWRDATSRGGRARPIWLATIGLLTALLLAGHVFAGGYVAALSNAAAPMFGNGGAGGGVPELTDGSTLDDIIAAPSPSAATVDTATGSPAASATVPAPASSPPVVGIGNRPLTMLFIGLDRGPGRDSARTDTIMLASFDPRASKLVMLSVPRDTGRVPLFDGGTYDPRINTFIRFARENPARYPDGPVPALVDEVAYLVGIPIDYWAVTDLPGMQQLVDLVGGIDVTIDQPIADPLWQLNLQPGTYRMTGAQVMAVVRSRFGPGNSDYERARRQQQVLKAFAQRMHDPALIARLPELLAAGSEVIRTNLPVDQLPDLLDVMSRAEQAQAYHVVLAPPDYAERIPSIEVDGRWMTELRMDAVAALSTELFGDRSRYWH